MDIIHGGDIYTAEEKLKSEGIAPEDILDFSANINPLDMPEGAAKAAAEAISLCSRYPDPLCRRLRKRLALWENVGEESLIFGAGAADLIFRICFALRPETGTVTAPSFEEYRLAMEGAGSQVKAIPLHEKNGFRPDFQNIKEALAGSDILFLCNPANPTGALMERDLLQRVAAECKKNGTILVMDECFLDLTEDPEEYTLKSLLAEGDGIIILKAFTKTFAMAGLRLGYAICASREIRDRIMRASQPWSVSVPAQEAALAALEDEDYLKRSRALIRKEKERLKAALEEAGYRVFPPAANYIFFKSEDMELREALERKGILIRSCANYEGLSEGYYRAAVRRPEENDRLIKELRKRKESLWQRV